MHIGIFELLMLVCFGASWPFNILKTWKNKSAVGKSFLFMVLIMSGYVFGIINKLIVGADWVVWAWVLNLLLVAIDFVLALTYRARERRAAPAAVSPAKAL